MSRTLKAARSLSAKAPLYLQLARHLEAAIAVQATRDVRLRLPPERDLSAMFGVSRITVRAALDVVARRRPVQRGVGKGAFIATPEQAGLPCVPLRLCAAPPWLEVPVWRDV